MNQTAGGAKLLLEAFAQHRIIDQARGQDLNGHNGAALSMARSVHGPHATVCDLIEHVVQADSPQFIVNNRPSHEPVSL
jgi:hypothetical protein